MQHYIVGFTVNNRHGNYYSARYNNTWVNNTEQAHAYQEYYARQLEQKLQKELKNYPGSYIFRVPVWLNLA